MSIPTPMVAIMESPYWLIFCFESALSFHSLWYSIDDKYFAMIEKNHDSVYRKGAFKGTWSSQNTIWDIEIVFSVIVVGVHFKIKTLQRISSP